MYKFSAGIHASLLLHIYVTVGRAGPVPMAGPLPQASIASITANIIQKLGEAAAGVLTKQITESIKHGTNNKYKVNNTSLITHTQHIKTNDKINVYTWDYINVGHIGPELLMLRKGLSILLILPY